MKKITLTSLLAVMASVSFAQNVQLHYDLGRNIYDEEAGRPKVTATFEHFSTDKAGSWFYFVDMDFKSKGAVGAYTEVSREFNLCKNSGLAAHVEYNGGLNLGASFQQSALVGPAWNGHNSDFSTTYSAQLLYKRYFKGDMHRAFHSVQLTGVWSTTFANKALTFSGYLDLWRDENINNHGKLVVMSEPQLWYNLNSNACMKDFNLSIGTELEISNNFIFNTLNDKTFFVNPTIGVKYTF